MPFLQTTTGKENNRLSLAQIECYYCHPGKKEENMWSAVKNYPEKISRVGLYTAHRSVSDVVEEIGGKWHFQSYDFAEGSIIKVWVRLKRGSGLADDTEIAAVYLRLRSQAAMRRIRIALLEHRNAMGVITSVLPSVAYEGRFDVLTLKEASQSGVIVDPAYSYQASRAQYTKLMAFEEVEREIAPITTPNTVTLITEQGKAAEFLLPGNRRDLDL